MFQQSLQRCEAKGPSSASYSGKSSAMVWFVERPLTWRFLPLQTALRHLSQHSGCRMELQVDQLKMFHHLCLGSFEAGFLMSENLGLLWLLTAPLLEYLFTKG
jgi:hypothetical protein